MHNKRDCKNLREGIEAKVAEAQKLFSNAVMFYDQQIYPMIRSIRDRGYFATADTIETDYIEFVEAYHQFHDRFEIPGRFASLKHLCSVYDAWNSFVLDLAERPTLFAKIASTEREHAQREQLALLLDLLDTSNKYIDDIISEHIAEIREADRTLLGALALIPTRTQYAQMHRELQTFGEITAAVTELNDIVHRADLIHTSLAQRYVK